MGNDESNVAVMGPRRYRLFLEGEGTTTEIAADLAKLRAAPKMHEALRVLIERVRHYAPAMDRNGDLVEAIGALDKADGKVAP